MRSRRTTGHHNFSAEKFHDRARCSFSGAVEKLPEWVSRAESLIEVHLARAEQSSAKSLNYMILDLRSGSFITTGPNGKLSFVLPHCGLRVL
jgi:hypothetical protein